MEKRYSVSESGLVIDNETQEYICDSCRPIFSTIIMIDLLNKYDKKIKELEEKLRLAKMGEAFEQERKNNALKNQNNKVIEMLEEAKTHLYPKWFDDKITELRGGENE